MDVEPRKVCEYDLRCITVYTKNYEVFSDLYEQIAALNLAENEEREIEGVVVSDAGEVPEDYIDKMREKLDVAIMKDKGTKIVILQHGDVFEVLIPEAVAETV